MNKLYKCLGLLLFVSLISGCGYTQKANLPNGITSIAIPAVVNAINIKTSYTYESGLETSITNAVRDRVIFDGNLRLKDVKQADSVLDISLFRFEQEAVGYDDLERVDRFRLFVVVELTLRDLRTQEVIWTEPNFSGSFIYSLSGPNSISESQAARNAIEKLARNIVDRIVEDW